MLFDMFFWFLKLYSSVNEKNQKICKNIIKLSTNSLWSWTIFVLKNWYNSKFRKTFFKISECLKKVQLTTKTIKKLFFILLQSLVVWIGSHEEQLLYGNILGTCPCAFVSFIMNNNLILRTIYSQNILVH